MEIVIFTPVTFRSASAVSILCNCSRNTFYTRCTANLCPLQVATAWKVIFRSTSCDPNFLWIHGVPSAFLLLFVHSFHSFDHLFLLLELLCQLRFLGFGSFQGFFHDSHVNVM